jgi:ankyrin repeat protein
MEKPLMLTDLLLHSIRANETVSGDWTALMWAAWYGELPVVKLLLQVPGIQVVIAHELLLRMRSLLLNIYSIQFNRLFIFFSDTGDVHV